MSRPFSLRGFAFFTVCVVLLLAMVSAPQAQTTRKKIRWERMQRDLDIMEGILNKLLMPSASDWDLLTNNPRGAFLSIESQDDLLIGRLVTDLDHRTARNH